MSEFKIGDIVRLKSGGPSLTVCAHYPDSNLYCSWFTEDGEFKSNRFVVESLVQDNL